MTGKFLRIAFFQNMLTVIVLEHIFHIGIVKKECNKLFLTIIFVLLAFSVIYTYLLDTGSKIAN